MSKKSPSTNAIVPVGGTGLTKSSSGLVRRGLELIGASRFSRPSIRVLVGNCEPHIDQLLLAVVAEVGGSERAVVTKSTEQASQLLEWARVEASDLLIVVVNNIQYESLDNWKSDAA